MLVKAGVLFRVTDSKYLNSKPRPTAHVGEPTTCAQLIITTRLLGTIRVRSASETLNQH